MVAAMARKASYHHGDLRRAILDASLSLIEKEGIGALSMREAARRAGATHGAPYHHFADRAAILAALAAEGFELMHGALRAADERARPDPLRRFRACGDAYFRFAREHTAHFRVMFRPELASPEEHPQVLEASGRAFAVLVEVLLDCQRAGLAPAGDVLPLVLTAWSTAHGLAALWVDGPLRTVHVGLPTEADALSDLVGATLTELVRSAGRKAKGRSR